MIEAMLLQQTAISQLQTHNDYEFSQQLKLEAISELRRAGEDLEQRMIDQIAEQFANAEPYIPSVATRTRFAHEVKSWFNRIPIPVAWHYDAQPFNTASQMRHFVETNNILPMYAAPSVFGTDYHKHRAVHDFYTHIKGEIPFGPIGELACYRIHKQMYSPELWPLIFSDVVLNNAYYERYGKFFNGEKYICMSEINKNICSHAQNTRSN